MSRELPIRKQTLDYFQSRLDAHGATPRGVDWNSEGAQETRFRQLAQALPLAQPFSLLDYGCGYAALADYLVKNGYALEAYTGFDILPGMVEQARANHPALAGAKFSSKLEELAPCDYAVASGIFNIKLDVPGPDWTAYVLSELDAINRLSLKGFSFNMLTSYSDADYMKPHLYYADPCLIFDYCKRHFSRNVALLHDYDLYDFTVIVRKVLG